MVPLLLLVLLNAVNAGYFYWATINLSEATRAGTAWSIMGSATTFGTQQLPPAGGTGSVSALVFNDISAFASSSNALVEVCTTTYSSGAPTSSCNNQYGTGTFPVATTDTDP